MTGMVHICLLLTALIINLCVHLKKTITALKIKARTWRISPVISSVITSVTELTGQSCTAAGHRVTQADHPGSVRLEAAGLTCGRAEEEQEEEEAAAGS